MSSCRASVALSSVLLFACSLLPAQGAERDEQWRMLVTPRYTVVSQLGDAATLKWAQDFDHYIEGLGAIMKLYPQRLSPLTAVIFAKERDFNPYKPLRPDGSLGKNYVGYFVRSDEGSVIGMANDGDREGTRKTIYHEATHWIMSTDPIDRPAWFEEGMAEFLSSYQEKSKRIEWGESIPSHVYLLNTASAIPLQKMLALTRADPLFNSTDHTSIFYAQSWALVHYLAAGKRNGSRAALHEYIEALQTQSQDEAFRSVFGADYPELERQLQTYLRGGRYSKFISPPLQRKFEARLVPAPPEAVEAAKGRLALGTGHTDLAEQHSERALVLAPQSPVGFELRAMLAMARRDAVRMNDAAESAVRRGSRNPFMFTIMARSYAERTTFSSALVLRNAADLYKEALSINPYLESPYMAFGALIDGLEDVGADDLQLLRNGMTLYPRATHLKFAMSLALEKTGKRDEALAQLDAILATPGVDPDAVSRVGMLRNRLKYGDLHSRINAHVAAREYSKALDLVDTLIREAGDTPDAALARQWRKGLFASARLEVAGNALGAGRRDEARSIYEQVAGMDQAPDDAREYARRALQRLPRK